MGFFDIFKKKKKMSDGLEKTRTDFFQNIVNTLTSSVIDDDLYNDLEEQLILADVGPSHKGTARAGEDDHQHLVVGLHRIQGGVQIPQDLLVQGVERLGAVHGQYSDGSALFKGYKRHSENSSLYLVHGGAVRPLLSLIIQQNIRAGKGNSSQSHRQPSGGIG